MEKKRIVETWCACSIAVWETHRRRRFVPCAHCDSSSLAFSENQNIWCGLQARNINNKFELSTILSSNKYSTKIDFNYMKNIHSNSSISQLSTQCCSKMARKNTIAFETYIKKLEASEGVRKEEHIRKSVPGLARSRNIKTIRHVQSRGAEWTVRIVLLDLNLTVTIVNIVGKNI